MTEPEGTFKHRNDVLEFMRDNRNEWLSSDNIFNLLKLSIPKRQLISWLKRWEKMGIVRKSTVSEVIKEGYEFKREPHFSSYMWKWHEGAEDVGE